MGYKPIAQRTEVTIDCTSDKIVSSYEQVVMLRPLWLTILMKGVRVQKLALTSKCKVMPRHLLLTTLVKGAQVHNALIIYMME